MATFASKLSEYEWWFFENGGMHVYNELKRLANSANTAQLGAGVAHGTTDFVTHCDPDVVEKVAKTTPVGFTDIATVKNGGRPPTQGQS